jgi:acetyl esterase/lipase
MENSKSKEFNFDPKRVVFAGDSAGGGLVSIILQRFARLNKTMPKLQVLTYPWLQMFNAKLPSKLEYKTKSTLRDTLHLSRLSLYYLGKSYLSSEPDLIDSNQHTLLVENQELKRKIKSFLSTDLIPEKYKQGKSYYKEYEKLKDEDIYPEKFSENSRLENDPDFRASLIHLHSVEMSPGLADDETLKALCKAYFLIAEWDVLKDEGLIYAERLRRSGVEVEVDFHQDMFHGGALFIDQVDNARIAFNNLVDYLRLNL